MIDIKLIRENPDFVRTNCKNRNYDFKLVDQILKLDEQWRILKKEDDEFRAERNKISKQISELKKQGKEVSKFLKQAKQIPEKLKKNEDEERNLKEKLDSFISMLPNIQNEDVPVGDESKNVEVKKVGELPKFDFPVKGHAEILTNLGLLDIERATKVSGSGFYFLKGELAQLERALINFMINFHVEDDFIEINPPQIVNAKTMFTRLMKDFI